MNMERPGDTVRRRCTVLLTEGIWRDLRVLAAAHDEDVGAYLRELLGRVLPGELAAVGLARVTESHGDRRRETRRTPAPEKEPEDKAAALEAVQEHGERRGGEDRRRVLSAVVKQTLEAAGVPQRELAVALGVNQSTVSRRILGDEEVPARWVDQVLEFMRERCS